jgi:hypothetical protein
MSSFRVGVQLHPQATTVERLLDGAVAAEEIGVDSVWYWDHFFPLYGDPGAPHFEAYTLLAAAAPNGCGSVPSSPATRTGTPTCWPTCHGPSTT